MPLPVNSAITGRITCQENQHRNSKKYDFRTLQRFIQTDLG